MNGGIALLGVIAGVCARARAVSRAGQESLPPGPVFAFEESKWKRRWRKYWPVATDVDEAKRRLGYEPAPIDYTSLCEGAEPVDPGPALPPNPEPEWPALPPISQLPKWWITMWLICRILDRLTYAWGALVGLLSFVVIVSGKVAPVDASDLGFCAAITFGPPFLLEVLAWVLKPPAP